MYLGIDRPTFSPDGKYFVYKAVKRNMKPIIVFDGKERKEYDWIEYGFIFSPNGKHFAYVTKRNNKWLIVLDGKEMKEYDDVSYPTFSPDSKHFTYIATKGRGEKYFVVLDGKEIKEYDSVADISFPIFSPDSKHFAYCVDEVIEKPGRKEFKEFVVLDGKEIGSYDKVLVSNNKLSDCPPFLFAPDSKYFYYYALIGKEL